MTKITDLSIRDFFLSLYIFATIIFGILWQGGEFFWFGFAGTSVYFLVLFYLNKNYQKSITLPHSSINILIILFSAWCFLTVIWSVAPHISLIRAFTISAAPIGLYSYFLLTTQAIKWETLWRIIIAAGMVLVVYSLIEISIGIAEPNSLFLNKNSHAAYLNLIILPTVAYYLLSNNKRTSLYIGLSLFLLIYSHALPGSRGATLGQFIGLSLILFLSRKSLNIHKLKQLGGIYFAAFALATVTTSNFLRFVKYNLEDADRGRWEIWAGAINLLKDTPWYGSGVGTYWLTHPAYRHINDPSSGQNAHNDYLQYLIEAGIPGFLLLVFLTITLIYYLYKSFKNPPTIEASVETSAILGALIAVGFHAFFTFNLGLFSILFLMGLLIGRLLYINNDTKKIILFEKWSIRKVVFSLSIVSTTGILLIYFVSLSSLSYFYKKAINYNIKGEITLADKNNSIALAIYPYDDRPYLLYTQIFSKIIEKIPELKPVERRNYFDKSLEYFETAAEKNRFRATNYYLHAMFLKDHASKFEIDSSEEIERLLQKALETNPRHIPSSKELSLLYYSQDKVNSASQVLFDAIKYYHPNTQYTLRLYKFSEDIIQEANIDQHLQVLKEKKAEYFEIAKSKGIENPEIVYEKLELKRD